MKRLFILLIALFFSVGLFPQDVRTLDTRVADLLARMPVYNAAELERQMNEMEIIGPEGREMILGMIVPSGSGDDTRARFVIESYSRLLSGEGYQEARSNWVNECIGIMKGISDTEQLSFLMRQLQYLGGEPSVEFVSKWLNDPSLCEPAIAVIASCRCTLSEEILLKSLGDNSLASPSSVINTLAGWGYDAAVERYAGWIETGDKSTKKAALNAIAYSSDRGAFKILDKAASDVNYGWDITGATVSYLKLAENRGEKGDYGTMEKICRKIIKSSPDNYYVSALKILTEFLGTNSIEFLEVAFKNESKEIRVEALRLFNKIDDPSVLEEMIELYEAREVEKKAEVIFALGERGDKRANGAVASALKANDISIRKEATLALVKIEGSESAVRLLEYIAGYEGDIDQQSGKIALMMIATPEVRLFLNNSLDQVPDRAKATIMKILAAGGENKYFQTALKYLGSANTELNKACYESLASFASSGDQEKLLDLLYRTDDPLRIGLVQDALGKAVDGIEDPVERSATLIETMSGKKDKARIIAVLPYAGGEKVLKTLLNEFENGSAETRDASFIALTKIRDQEALYSLFEIAGSGSKTYSSRAFDSYLDLVSSISVSDEQKLLMFRKIMPFAFAPDQKKIILEKLAGIRTFLSLMYVSNYFDNPELQSVAAQSALNIALPSTGSSTGMQGKIVKEILEMTVNLLEGEERDYNREKVRKYLETLPDDEGFVSMFNGTDLSGWQGLVENPVSRAKMSKQELAAKQAEADGRMTDNWSVKDGMIWFNGNGANLCSIKDYGDFELIVDWKISKAGDSGIYLRGTPQVQIWDTSRVEVGAQVGSGGLYNNSKNESKPLVVADNPVGDWNSFRIIMIGERVSVWLNGILVVDNVVMENYWDRSIPIFPIGAIELQAHGNELAFRDIYVKEINEEEYNLTSEEKAEGFVALLNGKNLDNWTGNKESYIVEEGMIVVTPTEGSGGNLYTEKEYADFNFRFEFQLTPGANNGLGIRAPLTGDAAYVGMELQILDNTAEIYAELQPYQYHGSVYGVLPARRGFLRPVGEWNEEEVIVKGTKVTIILNGTTIVDGDIAGPRDNGTMDHRDHPGLKNRKGHIGFLGHGSIVKFRNIRIKEL